MLKIADLMLLAFLLFVGYIVVILLACFIEWHWPVWGFPSWSNAARMVWLMWAIPCTVIALWPETKK